MPPTHTDEGLVAAEEIRDSHPNVGVLVLSHYLEARYALRLLEHHPGGVGYLLKERVSDVAVLTDALARLHDGECVVDATIVSRLVNRARPAGRLDELTPREREVLALIAERRSNKASATGSSSARRRSRRTSSTSSRSSASTSRRPITAASSPCSPSSARSPVRCGD